MPFPHELVNTEVAIYRPVRSGPGGDEVGASTLVAKGLPGYIEERHDARRQDVPVISSEDAIKIKIWIEGVDNSGNVLDVRRRDQVEWLDHLGNVIDPRWEIEQFRPWMKPGGIDHMVLEAKP